MVEIAVWFLSFTGLILAFMFVNSVGKKNRLRRNYHKAKDLGTDLTGVKNPDEMDETIPGKIWIGFKFIYFIFFWAIVAIAIFSKTKEFFIEAFPLIDIVRLIVVGVASAIVIFFAAWLYKKLIHRKIQLDSGSGLMAIVDDNKSDITDNKRLYMKVFLLILVVLVQIGLWNLAYESGYDDGHSIGWDEGWGLGWEGGHSTGKIEGFD
jgi:hypothetical protein